MSGPFGCLGVSVTFVVCALFGFLVYFYFASRKWVFRCQALFMSKVEARLYFVVFLLCDEYFVLCTVMRHKP